MVMGSPVLASVMGERCCSVGGWAQADVQVAAVGRQSKLRMGRLQNSDELPNIGEESMILGVKRKN